MRGEGGGYAVVLDAEADLREERPEAAPAAGEHAGPGGGFSVAEAVEDVEEDVVGQRAQAVLPLPLLADAGAGGAELGSLGGGFPPFLDALRH